MKDIYDVIIIGAGPAGLAAGIYAGRSRLAALLIEKAQDGGQISMTDVIENYPGQMPEGESGATLIARMTAQAEIFGVERAADTIKEVRLGGDIKEVTGLRQTYKAKAVILATGAVHRPIGCKGEVAYRGRGVSYCATCDAGFFEDLDVYVVGGGDSAVQEALYLTKFARNVTIIHRRDALRAVGSLQERAFANKKIHFFWDSVVDEIGGEDVVQWMLVRNTKTGETRKVEASKADGLFGVFGFVGLVPVTQLFEGQIKMENGYILTDEDMKTNVAGVWATGDMRKKSLRQVVTAAADGAIAAMQVDAYLTEKNHEVYSG
ncbi:thioredoxin reductase [Megasphaera cerevisiae DSM 20462]|jgi:thioredoxin reductase (NADPH)|uniref:Thioredoxin reductase n=1 Tax=Megasphaera cerevisiae DSM 20462 TaxID=1122219 RepID=A0A0J6WSW4_9FIRM|nr:thioredoxin-disulfide reductase [Megasphaera cerevisiae]KMO86600.1 thioredoxin reductase [Megasphaera cerevisiae DSM 20462]OKY53263.1 thioredoxin-disulfide reductase [Megasphaera cerevisiae]SJZ69895.1 thioredoxin reductase (NADPH) [Megasphaera cerevisiae DSM 20462]